MLVHPARKVIMTPCIEWNGCRNKLGYGRKAYKGKSVLVHRLAYAEAHNLDVFTMSGVVMHTCDNPSCYNIAHLVLGTNASNSKDKVNKQRHTRGTAVWCAKLTLSQVHYIRQHYIKGKNRFQPSNATELASMFDVHPRTIVAIATGEHKYEH